MFYVGRQGVTYLGIDGVSSLIGVLHDHVACVIHHVGVAARRPRQSVRVAGTCQPIVAHGARERPHHPGGGCTADALWRAVAIHIAGLSRDGHIRLCRGQGEAGASRTADGLSIGKPLPADGAQAVGIGQRVIHLQRLSRGG